MHVKYYKTAGITVEVRSDFPIGQHTFHPKFKQFEVNEPEDDNVVIQHHFYLPDLTSKLTLDGKEIYRKNQWEIHRMDNSWIYQFKSIFPVDPGHSATGIFSENYSTLSVFTDHFNEESYQKARLPALTLFNTDQVMFAKLLCDREGLIIHSNGFDVNGNGILLAGTSGTGKSTLSSMLKAQGHKILCDDRMFITKKKNGFWIHGNWCHGSEPDSAAGSVPLKAILFLQQSDYNTIEEIHDIKIVTHQLLRALVQPFLMPAGWEKTFDIIESMVQLGKHYQVKFDLSGDICDKIEQLLRSGKTKD